MKREAWIPLSPCHALKGVVEGAVNAVGADLNMAPECAS
jgi:hypothetical protein